MKRLTLQYFLAAAALTVVAGSASAQTWLKAEIPFTFRAGSALMDPGSYDVRLPEGAAHYLVLRNNDTGKAVMATYGSPEQPKLNSSDPGRLVFACAGSRCILQQVWPGDGGTGYSLPAPKFSSGESVIAREIPLTKGNTN